MGIQWRYTSILEVLTLSNILTHKKERERKDSRKRGELVDYFPL
jgi:hypothetical protein